MAFKPRGSITAPPRRPRPRSIGRNAAARPCKRPTRL